MKIGIKILVSVLALIGVAIVVVLVVAMTRPDEFHIERSARVEAPRSAVFAQVNDFHQWSAWSPWAKLDPQMQTRFEGPQAGVGASYYWSGNDEVGEGSMRIIESNPDSKVAMALDFLKPFKASNLASFTLVPEGTATKITWAMDGKNQLLSKVMCLFMDMDKLVGADFERGLANLKGVVERPSETAVAGTR